MRKFLAVICISVCIGLMGCGDSADSGNSDQAANSASEALPQYSDASTALADGTRFLDTGEVDKAIDALDQAVKLDPNLAEAWFKLGIAFALAEKRDETLGTNTNEPSPTEKKSTEKKTNSEKAFEKAVAAYKKMIDANGEDDVAYFNLGRAYNKLNEDQDASKALKQAVKLKPDDTEYQTELGAILIKLAQYHEAIPPLKKALELDPENIRAQELLEDAEAGRKRVNYSATPKEDKKSSNTNSNSNTTTDPPDEKVPPLATPRPGPPKTRPTPNRPA